MCRYGAWVPQVTIGYSLIDKRGIWVFGVTNEGKTNGVLHFRKYPDYECTEFCYGCTPVEYSAEVIYVPWYGVGKKPVYSPDEVPLTYIPPGKYLVTSPFTIKFNTKIWYFADDGNRALMEAHIHADEKFHDTGGTIPLTLQVTNQFTGKQIQVDTITGKVVLPDQTEEEITTDMWSWNPDEKHYECNWNKTPQEGLYTVFVTAKKASYNNAEASTTFMICYTGQMEITYMVCYDGPPTETPLIVDPPIFARGDCVEMIVKVFDENGDLVQGDIEGVVISPEGIETYLDWGEKEDSPGAYVARYYHSCSHTTIMVS